MASAVAGRTSRDAQPLLMLRAGRSRSGVLVDLIGFSQQPDPSPVSGSSAIARMSVECDSGASWAGGVRGPPPSRGTWWAAPSCRHEPMQLDAEPLWWRRRRHPSRPGRGARESRASGNSGSCVKFASSRSGVRIHSIGWAATGKPDVARRISSTIGSIRSGSRPQFAPRMSAPSPARMRVASGETPPRRSPCPAP